MEWLLQVFGATLIVWLTLVAMGPG